MYKFEMNGNNWYIDELPKQEMINIYEKETKEENTIYCYGITIFPDKKIFINQDMVISKKKMTLKHELMHCYIEEYCSSNRDDYTEEELCNISANSHDIIHKIVEDYFKQKENK